MAPVEPTKHVAHLKKHRNALYAIVFILLILQVVSFVVISSQISRVRSDQNALQSDLEQSLDDARQQTRYSVEELTKEFAKQRGDVAQSIAQQQLTFQSQLDILKSSQQDFSSVIEQNIRGVVSIGTDKSAASGFIVSEDGYVLTNNHAITEARFVKVLTYDEKVYDAQIINQDAFLDLALLKIEGHFQPLSFADSDSLNVGARVIAIGNPLGLSFSVTQGIVSAVHRNGPNGLPYYIQTDVTLNPGNSGGPLINQDGKVVGINNFKVGGAEGLGFALESHQIVQTINTMANSQLVNYA